LDGGAQVARQRYIHRGFSSQPAWPFGLHAFTVAGRRTARFYTAGLKQRVIAEIMGCDEDHIEKIIRRYVGRSAATKAIIRQLNERRT
jgi:hypothetical protein